GRIGESDATRPFLIGPRRESTVPVAGRLFIGVNQGSNDRAGGSFKVVIERTTATVDPNAKPEDWDSLPTKLTQEHLDGLPRRVGDAAGTEGDRLNFLLVGSEDRVKAALAAAGWVTVDRTAKDSIFRGAIGVLSKQSYVTMPMSELLMFGRAQDY